jgi:monothiol glutaredoxin
MAELGPSAKGRDLGVGTTARACPIVDLRTWVRSPMPLAIAPAPWSEPEVPMLDETTRKFIEHLIQNNKVVLFMKGNRSFPQCGFSAAVVEVLKKHGVDFHTVNVLQDPAIRDGIKEFSEWPTIPQLYVGGEFLGGCDIVREMDANGELARKLSTLAS